MVPTPSKWVATASSRTLSMTPSLSTVSFRKVAAISRVPAFTGMRTFRFASGAVTPPMARASEYFGFAIDREEVANNRPAARADRRFLVQPIELLEPVRNRIGLILHRHRGIADSRPGDFARRCQIAFHQQGRYAQNVADIVEAVTDVVGRQQVVDV